MRLASGGSVDEQPREKQRSYDGKRRQQDVQQISQSDADRTA